MSNFIAVSKANSITPILIKWEFDWDSNYHPPYYLGDEQIIKKLSNVFNETLGGNEFELTITMDKVPEWDSLKHIQLLTSIESAFGIEIQFEDTLKMISVKSIISEIKKYITDV